MGAELAKSFSTRPGKEQTNDASSQQSVFRLSSWTHRSSQ